MFAEGDVADRVFIIMDGEFMVSKLSKNIINDEDLSVDP